MFSRAFLGNVEACRTEAEITDEWGRLVAVLYEDETGWHCERTAEPMEEARALEEFVETVKADLSHYVNRCGTNPPPGLSRAGLSMWLMEKDDGTAMGRRIR